MYGRYLGDRTAAGAFPYQAGESVPHGWLQLPDGTIFDPTAWAFTSREPRIVIAAVEDQRYVL